MATALTGTIAGGYTAPTVINVHFLDDGSGTGSIDFASFTDPNGNTFGADGWTTYERQQAGLAFQQFAAVADVTFNFVDDLAQADFVMVTGDAAEVGAPGYWSVGGGTITVDGSDFQVDGVGVFNWQAADWDSSGVTGTLEIGGRGFVTLLQEIGHGLGLAHPHDSDGGSTVMAGVGSPTGDHGDFDLNQGVYTTMSLNGGWRTAPHGPSPSDRWGWQAGPMALDIAVLQEKYGANTGTNLGDTLYEMPQRSSTGTFYQAIWDAGGTDTIRYGGLGDAVIDLRPATLQYEAGGGGFVSHVPGIHGGFTIAQGVVIEDAVGGPGNDTLIGNAADNTLTGGPGADELSGGPGRDTASYTAAGPVTADLADPASNTGDAAGDIYLSIETLEGSSFDDRLFGDAGDNTLLGGAGNDSLHGSLGADVLDGGPGIDTASYRLAAAGVVADLGNAANNQGAAAGDVYIGIEALEGSSFDDRLLGDAGDNTLPGGAGDDELFGRAGNDVLRGSGGDDVLRGGAGSDRLFGGADVDRLFGGGEDDVLRGGGANDVLRGGGGNDRLFGGGGHDRLLAGGGDDVLRGGGGDHRLGGGGDSDRLVGGDGSDRLVGGAGSDRLIGGGDDDVMRGGAGDDVLIGGPGDDRLVGGAGADAFVFQPNGGNDLVVNFEDGMDVLDFRAFDFDGNASVLDLASQVGAGVVFDLPGGATAELSNFDINLLGAADVVI